MARTPHYVWEGREYDHEPKGGDWYATLGIVALALIIAAVLFGQYLLAVLVLVAAATLALPAAKDAPLPPFELPAEGLGVGGEFHAYAKMQSFSILEDPED